MERKMKDKSLGIWLIALFGLTGLAAVTLAWFWPTLESDRAITTAAGSIGIIVAGVQGLMLRQSGSTEKPVSIEIEINDKS